jgi:hypothetical protein
VALVAGDAASFLVFAGLGRSQHGEASGLSAVGQIAGTAVPFALGWYLVAPWLGAYRRRLTTGVRSMLRRTELAWVCAWPVAMVLRLVFVDHKVPSGILSFALVVLLSNALFLGLWRGVFAWASLRLGR